MCVYIHKVHIYIHNIYIIEILKVSVSALFIGKMQISVSGTGKMTNKGFDFGICKNFALGTSLILIYAPSMKAWPQEDMINNVLF